MVSRIKKLAVLFLLGVGIGIAYYNALGNGFVFDDYLLVVDKAAIRRVAAEPVLALSPKALGYRPLRTLSYVLDYRLAGIEPWIFHLTNVFYHWVTAFLVFLVTLRLSNGGSSLRDGDDADPNVTMLRWRLPLFVALLWALHPVQTDSVTYVSGRRDILGGLFLFLGLWSYLRFRTARPLSAGRYGWLLLTCLVYGLGILSKESVLVLPLLCWLYDCMHEGVMGSLRRRWAQYFVILLLGTAVLWYFAGPMISPLILRLSWLGGSAESNFATVVRIWTHYLKVMVFPQRLIADYSAFPVSLSFFDPRVLGALGILGMTAMGAWLLSRWRPLIGFGALWLLVTILPVSHLIPIKEIAAEHFLYVPLFGMCLMLGAVLDGLCGPRLGNQASRPRLREGVVYAVVVALLTTATARVIDRNRDWVDEETFWTVTSRAVPGSARAHYNLAGVYLQQRRAEEAKREFTATLSIVPRHVDALAGLGEIAYRGGQYGQALGYAMQAEDANPRSFRVKHLLGWIFLALEKPVEAEKHFKQAAELRPSYARTYVGLEAVAEALGDKDAAALWASKRRALEGKGRLVVGSENQPQ
jgi:Tfp pilus assembly protein PilF